MTEKQIMNFTMRWFIFFLFFIAPKRLSGVSPSRWMDISAKQTFDWFRCIWLNIYIYIKNIFKRNSKLEKFKQYHSHHKDSLMSEESLRNPCWKNCERLASVMECVRVSVCPCVPHPFVLARREKRRLWCRRRPRYCWSWRRLREPAAPLAQRHCGYLLFAHQRRAGACVFFLNLEDWSQITGSYVRVFVCLCGFWPLCPTPSPWWASGCRWCPLVWSTGTCLLTVRATLLHLQTHGRKHT